MDYCIYLRKSRADAEAEARGEMETLARHENTLLSLAKSMKLNIVSIYKEIESGDSIVGRPVMQQLLSEVEQCKWAGVLVMEVERLARGNTMDQGLVANTFKFSNTKIITPMKSYDPQNEFDEEYFEFGLFMSRREYKVINRRLQAGRIASVKEGKYVGNKPPYGYERVKLDNQKGFTLKIIPEEAEAVKIAFNLYLYGEQLTDGTIRDCGYRAIAYKLTDSGIKPRFNDKWSPASVAGMLSNPVYIGLIRWGHRAEQTKIINGVMIKSQPRTNINDYPKYQGIHEAIIDEKVFWAVQDKLLAHEHMPVQQQYTIKNPLASLMVCGKCSMKMIRRPSKSYPDMLICTNPYCDNVGSTLTLVEDYVIITLKQWLEEYKYQTEQNKVNNSSEQIELKQKTVKKLEKDIMTYKLQLENLHNLLEQGIYSPEKFIERNALLSEKIHNAQNQFTTISQEIYQDKINLSKEVDFIPKVQHALDTYYSLDTAKERNDTLLEVIDRVVYIKNESGRFDKSKMASFELELVPKMPK